MLFVENVTTPAIAATELLQLIVQPVQFLTSGISQPTIPVCVMTATTVVNQQLRAKHAMRGAPPVAVLCRLIAFRATTRHSTGNFQSIPVFAKTASSKIKPITCAVRVIILARLVKILLIIV